MATKKSPKKRNLHAVKDQSESLPLLSESQNPNEAPLSDGSQTTSGTINPFEVPADETAPLETASEPIALDNVQADSADVGGTAAMGVGLFDALVCKTYFDAPLTEMERAELERDMVAVLVKHNLSVPAAPEVKLGITLVGIGLPRWREKQRRAAEQAQGSEGAASDTTGSGQNRQWQERDTAKTGVEGFAGFGESGGGASDLLP